MHRRSSCSSASFSCGMRIATTFGRRHRAAAPCAPCPRTPRAVAQRRSRRACGVAASTDTTFRSVSSTRSRATRAAAAAEQSVAAVHVHHDVVGAENGMRPRAGPTPDQVDRARIRRAWSPRWYAAPPTFTDAGLPIAIAGGGRRPALRSGSRAARTSSSRQHPPLALGERAERERPDRDANEAQHVDAQLGEHSPNVPVLSLVEHDLQPCAAAGSRAQQR